MTRKHFKTLPETLLFYNFDDRTLATLAGTDDDNEDNTNLDCRNAKGDPVSLDGWLNNRRRDR